MAVDGNKQAQEEYLIEMARKYVEQIRISQCTPDTAMYTYNSCFINVGHIDIDGYNYRPLYD